MGEMKGEVVGVESGVMGEIWCGMGSEVVGFEVVDEVVGEEIVDEVVDVENVGEIVGEVVDEVVSDCIYIYVCVYKYMISQQVHK